MAPTHPSPPAQQQQPQPYPVYPLPIPPEKFDRAVVLYGRLRLEEGLQQREQQRHSPSHLHPVQQHGRSHSVASRTSSGQHSPSGATSNYGATTESVVSFDDNGSPSSAAANAGSGLVAFDGSVVKTRTRRPLSPMAKAKAALIRHLGSCWVCRSRRVPCPLEHIDIEALEEGLRRRNLKVNRQPRDGSSTRETRSHSTPEPTQSGSRPSMASDVMRSHSQRLPHSGGFSAQMDSLAYLGQNEELLQTPTNIAADSHSPIYPDPLSAIHAQGTPFTFPNYEPHTPIGLPALGINSYTNHQHGDMFQLGVNLGFAFQCRHLDLEGGCQQIFANEEELQIHFESHFAFNRILPPHRYRCSVCSNMTGYPTDMCFSCGSDATIEHLIMGSFIRTESYQRYSPDGHDFFSGRNNESDPFSASLFTMPGANNGMGPGMGNGGSGSMNQGGYGYHQNNNTYRTQGPAPGPHGGNFGGYNGTEQGGFQFRGSESGEANELESEPVQSWHMKTLQTFRRHKTVLLPTTLLFAVALAVETHDFFITKARTILLHPNLPFIGFIAVMVSFAMCHIYWHIKHPPISQQDTGSLRRSSKSALDISSAISSFNFRPAAPAAPAFRGRIYL